MKGDYYRVEEHAEL